MGENRKSMEEILQPGVQIRPIISPKEVSEIVQRLYGLRNVHISELNAYDDKNYYIQVDIDHKSEQEQTKSSEHSRSIIVHGAKHPWTSWAGAVSRSVPIKPQPPHPETWDDPVQAGYPGRQELTPPPLPVTHWLDQHRGLVPPAHPGCSNEINCPKPVKNVDGLYYSVEQLPKNGLDACSELPKQSLECYVFLSYLYRWTLCISVSNKRTVISTDGHRNDR
uniref:Uncharacterized protein n=1 Tax=Timema shepardi TaxID=629360 RepID=A0A7R9G4I9_TIMSH|nr:unnamed protein product [Timema shepardi]